MATDLGKKVSASRAFNGDEDDDDDGDGHENWILKFNANFISIHKKEILF